MTAFSLFSRFLPSSSFHYNRFSECFCSVDLRYIYLVLTAAFLGDQLMRDKTINQQIEQNYLAASRVSSQLKNRSKFDILEGVYSKLS